MTKLSSRLESIAQEIPEYSSVVDIGCDHGFLDIYLLENKQGIRVIASDVNQNALNQAKRNIKRRHLEDKITTVLSNGLDNIDTKGIDTIVISGMGAHTIVGILYQNLKKLKSVNRLILQSNNDLDFLRYKVTKIGYFIEKEKLIRDAGIVYTIIVFKKGHKFYSKKQLYFGPCLLKENGDLFQEKLQCELNKLEQFYPMIPKSHYHHRYKTYWRMKALKKVLFRKER